MDVARRRRPGAPYRTGPAPAGNRPSSRWREARPRALAARAPRGSLRPGRRAQQARAQRRRRRWPSRRPGPPPRHPSRLRPPPCRPSGPLRRRPLSSRRSSWRGDDRAGREGLYATASATDPVPPPVLAWQHEVHVPGIYDLEVDTGVLTPQACAAAIGHPPALRPRPVRLQAALVRPLIRPGPCRPIDHPGGVSDQRFDSRRAECGVDFPPRADRLPKGRP